jgi:hypothetical protein
VSDLARQRLSHLETPFPGGQSYVQVVHQTRDLLDDVMGEFDGARVLLPTPGRCIPRSLMTAEYIDRGRAAYGSVVGGACERH